MLRNSKISRHNFSPPSLTYDQQVNLTWESGASLSSDIDEFVSTNEKSIYKYTSELFAILDWNKMREEDKYRFSTWTPLELSAEGLAALKESVRYPTEQAIETSKRVKTKYSEKEIIEFFNGNTSFKIEKSE